MNIKKEWEKFTNELKKMILENTRAFESMDLKLHDVSFAAYETHYPSYFERHLDSYFDDFCKMNFDFLTEETNFLEYAEYIGRTSKFYLFDRDICKFVQKLDPESKLIDRIACDMIYNYDQWTANYLPLKNDSRNWNEEDWKNMEIIYTNGGHNGDDNIFSAVITDTRDRINTYKYIENFKKNQITYWNEYIDETIAANEAWDIKANVYVISDYTENKAIFRLHMNINDEILQIGKKEFNKENYEDIDDFWKLLNDDKVKEAFQL